MKGHLSRFPRSAPRAGLISKGLFAALASSILVSCLGPSAAPSQSPTSGRVRGPWHVTGSVTSASNVVSAGVTVVAYRAEQDACCLESDASVTDRAGRYSLNLGPGVYRIHFKPPPGSHLGPQWWRNEGLFLAASKLTVSADVDGIDATLGNGHVVAGSVTDRVGRTPLLSVGVFVYESLGPATDQRLVTHTRTDAAGRYSVSVPAGTFRLSFVPPELSRVVSQWWPNSALPVFAGDVNVSEDVGGIDIALPPGMPITGRVTDARTGAPLARFRVLAVIGCCDTVGVAFTDATGAYRVLVASGSYRIYFLPPADTAYRITWWRGAADYEHSAEVVVADVPVGGIDAALERR